MSRPEALQVPPRTDYYDQAESWAAQLSRLEGRSNRLGWIVAGIAGGIALLEAAALAMLVPVKTTVPYVVTVDRQTGYAQLAQKLAPGGTITQQDAVIQSAIVQYVLARETFDASDLTQQYRKVQLWSDAATARGYVQEMARSNPQSPLNLYPASTTRQITVKSVNMISPGVAIVRFDAQRVDPASTSGQVQSYSATIAFRFSGAPMRMEDRFINPLGFQVTRYRRDAETTGPVATGAGTIGIGQ